jgi:sulfite reductase (NADPH) flavoprotein alpha-component
MAAQDGALFLFDSAAPSTSTATPVASPGRTFHIETRPGAGSALVGYISQLGRSAPASVAILSPSSLLSAAPALSSLPPITERAPLLALVPQNEHSIEDLSLVPATSQFLAAVKAFDSARYYDPAVIVAGKKHELAESIKTAQDVLKRGRDVILAWDAIAIEDCSGMDVLNELRVNTSFTATDGNDVASKKSLEDDVRQVVGEDTKFFRYFGPRDAATAIVVPASIHSSLALATLSATKNKSLGLLVAKVLRPWSAADLKAALPETVTTLHVFAEAGPGQELLVDDVRKSTQLNVVPLTSQGSKLWSLVDWFYALNVLSKSPFQTYSAQATDHSSPFARPQVGRLIDQTSLDKLAVFWSADDSPSANLPRLLADTFVRVQEEGGVQPRLATWYDNYSGTSLGVASSALLLSPGHSADATYERSHPLHAIVQSTPPDLLLISDPAAFLRAYNPLMTISHSTQLVFSAPWSPEEVRAKLTKVQRESLTERSWVINTEAIAQSHLVSVGNGRWTPETAKVLVEEAAFWAMYLRAAEAQIDTTSTIVPLLRGSHPELDEREAKDLVEALKDAILRVPTNAEVEVGKGPVTAPTEADSTAMPLAPYIVPNATRSNPLKTFVEPTVTASPKWYGAAQRLIFPEAFGLVRDEEASMRPDLPEKNFILTVTENRRLTPDDYDRNVFHMELSTKGTGLKYAVGEALGVHGWNDEAEVRELIEWLGYDENQIVSVPSREDPLGSTEQRTLFQVFQQNLDVFGKPGRSFYEALSAVATNREEARHLRFISSAEGSSTFKKWADIDTVTYADVLKAFPSAKDALGLEGLLREIAPLKPRHYSIASSQNFVGDSVHLLVVTVDWKNPKGARRLLFPLCLELILNLRRMFRRSSLWSMYPLSGWSSGGRQGHGVGQAFGHEAPTSRRPADHHGRSGHRVRSAFPITCIKVYL